MIDVGIIAADTTRTRAYLQIMAKNKIFPSFALVLENQTEKNLPGQINKLASDESRIKKTKNKGLGAEEFDIDVPIADSISNFGIPCKILNNSSINSEEVQQALLDRPEKVFIFSGFGGELLKPNVLGIGKSFLHVHGGFLPDFKGSTTNYYSLIANQTMGASAIFLTAEIDSGPVLSKKKFAPPENRHQIDYQYDAIARAVVLVDTLSAYIDSGEWEIMPPCESEGETYFIIHPVLKHISILDGRESKEVVDASNV